MSQKILHTADIHLREYKDDRWKTLQRMIEIGTKVKKILIGII
jgi:DNA repair exonuclease SbcCD nuclease subunit